MKFDPWESQEKMRQFVPKIRFVIDGRSGCWNVTSHKAAHKCKYPRINVLTDSGRKSVRLHRYLFPIFHGEIKDGLCILHKCDNRACINPEHLRQGTDAENTLDKIKNGNLRIGEDHGTAKLTAADVRHIREMWESGIYTQVGIGKMYQISSAHVCAITKRRFWKNV